MELLKVTCYECGREYPIPAAKRECNCRDCQSTFVENIPLARVPLKPEVGIVGHCRTGNGNGKSLYVNREGYLYERDCANPYDSSPGPSSNFFPRKTNFEQIMKMEICGENSENSENCNICLEAMENGDRICKLDNCNHVYHFDCLITWVKVKNNCPTCTRIAFN